jgi:DNA primase
VLGFGGRIIKTDPKAAKYVNTPETEIYHKSRIVYGIFQARQAIIKEDRCYLVEGYTDVLSMHESGVENVVASSGTALTQEQIRLIKRFTPNITMLYDGDPAGIKASIRGTDMVLEEGMNVRIVMLPDGEDPDSWSRKTSDEEFKRYLKENETDFIKFKTRLLLDEAQSDPVRRANLVREVVRSIAVIPDQITRTVYVKECSTQLNMPEEVILDEVMKLRNQDSFRNRNSWPAQDSASGSLQDMPGTAATSTSTSASQRQRKKEETSFYSEREILRLLIRYGAEVLTRELDKETGIETFTTVDD